MAGKYQKERDSIIAENNQVDNIKAKYKKKEWDLEMWYFVKKVEKVVYYKCRRKAWNLKILLKN